MDFKNRKIINFLEQNNINILLTIEKKDFELDSKNIKILEEFRIVNVSK